METTWLVKDCDKYIHNLQHLLQQFSDSGHVVLSVMPNSYGYTVVGYKTVPATQEK